MSTDLLVWLFCEQLIPFFGREIAIGDTASLLRPQWDVKVPDGRATVGDSKPKLSPIGTKCHAGYCWCRLFTFNAESVGGADYQTQGNCHPGREE